MPTIETPVITDLRPFEELTVATKASSSSSAGGAGAFHKNTFSSMITFLGFMEDYPLPEGAAEDAAAAASKLSKSKAAAAAAASGKKGKTAPSEDNPFDGVRVSLVARMGSSSGRKRNREDPQPGTFTLASWTFGPVTAGEAPPREPRRRNRHGAEDSKEGGDNTSKEGEDAGPYVNGGRPDVHKQYYPVSLKSPLLFRSNDSNVESLAVVAHVVPAAELAVDSDGVAVVSPTPVEAMPGKRLRPYFGGRRFAVRLMGLQQTELTDHQVMLLTS